MAIWSPSNFKITQRGAEILAKVAAGNGALTVSKIGAGAGYTAPADLAALTAVNDERQTLTLVKKTSTAGSTDLSVRLMNTGLAASYTLQQLGIYVTHPDYSGDQLYMIAQVDSGSGDTIPLPSVNPVTLNFTLRMLHTGVSTTSVTVSSAGMVSQLDFEAFQSSVNTGKANTIHTHAVSDLTGVLPVANGGTGQATLAGARNALGLGNTTGALPVANGGTGSANAADARAALGITPANIGASATGHTHAFADITGTINDSTGTLSVAKGGTGSTDAAAARTALGITLANLGAAAASHQHAPADLTAAVPVTKGGTGAADAATARTNLGITPSNIGAAPTSHSHAPSDLTASVPVEKGGTGAATAADARTNLGITLANLNAASADHTHSLTDSAVTGVLPVSKGGTGAATVAAARNVMGLGNTSGALPVANGGTGAVDAAAARAALGVTLSNLGAAPTSHAVTDTTYGVASATNYGHAKASSATPSAPGVASVGTDDGTFARGDHTHQIQTSVSGNAGTATALQNARKINGVSFNGTADITFGALYPTQITTGTDLNTLTQAGEYYCDDPTVVASLVNCPTTLPFHMSVGKHNGVYQEVKENSLNVAKRYFRNYNVTWGVWFKDYTSADPQIDISGLAAQATKLATPRSIALGGVTATPQNFDGSANITITISAVPASLLTGAVAVANGGTGATSASAARTNLGVPPISHVATDGTYGSASATNYGHAKASSLTPAVAGAGAVGTDDGTFARGDHVHPAQPNVTGNAGTATALQTARGISITGGATGAAVAFDGTADIAISVTALDMTKATNILPVANGGTGVNSLAGIRNALGLGNTTGALPIANGGTGATTVAAARNALGLGNTAGALPVANGGTGSADAASARDALGVPPISHTSLDGAFGVSTASAYGHAKASSTTPAAAGVASVGTEVGAFARGDHVHPVQTSVSGNAGTATKLQTARTITLAAGATGSASFDGSANITVSVTAVNMAYATGTLGVANGGTGQTTLAGIRNALGLGNTTGAVPVANGGTGATDAATARSNLGITPGNIGAAYASHGHDGSAIVSGIVPVAVGGTGQTSLAGLRNAAGLGNTTGAVPVANGGTGASSATAALTNLGIFYSPTLPTTGVEGQICLVPIA